MNELQKKRAWAERECKMKEQLRALEADIERLCADSDPQRFVELST